MEELKKFEVGNAITQELMATITSYMRIKLRNARQRRLSCKTVEERLSGGAK